jgi:hypothetical protein
MGIVATTVVGDMAIMMTMVIMATITEIELLKAEPW